MDRHADTNWMPIAAVLVPSPLVPAMEICALYRNLPDKIPP
jgi:hypothetical protein